MTLVLIGKDLVLEGSSTKIEDKRVPGIQYLYLYILKALVFLKAATPWIVVCFLRFSVDFFSQLRNGWGVSWVPM